MIPLASLAALRLPRSWAATPAIRVALDQRPVISEQRLSASAVLDQLLHHSHVLNIRGRAPDSGRNDRLGCSRRNSIWPFRGRKPTTTTRTDKLADQNQVGQF